MLAHNQHIQQKLIEKFGEGVYNFEETYETLHFDADKDFNLKILNFLKSEQDLAFNFLTDLCAVHYPDNKGKEIAVVYNIHNIAKNIRVRFKVYTDINNPEVYTATSIYAAANWLERETYDFFGVIFVGHPNLKRIMNVEEMDYFPLRKEYPLEDQSRTDKDDEMFGRQVMQRPMIN